MGWVCWESQPRRKLVSEAQVTGWWFGIERDGWEWCGRVISMERPALPLVGCVGDFRRTDGWQREGQSLFIRDLELERIWVFSLHFQCREPS